MTGFFASASDSGNDTSEETVWTSFDTSSTMNPANVGEGVGAVVGARETLAMVATTVKDVNLKASSSNVGL
jgi:hypothetical protein